MQWAREEQSVRGDWVRILNDCVFWLGAAALPARCGRRASGIGVTSNTIGAGRPHHARRTTPPRGSHRRRGPEQQFVCGRARPWAAGCGASDSRRARHPAATPGPARRCPAGPFTPNGGRRPRPDQVQAVSLSAGAAGGSSRLHFGSPQCWQVRANGLPLENGPWQRGHLKS